MKTFPLRITAVLALLALAPCARAVSVTQTFTYSINASLWGTPNLNLGKVATFTAAGLGLVSVVLDFHLAGTGSGQEYNPFTFPMTYTPTIGVSSQHRLVGFSGTVDERLALGLGAFGTSITGQEVTLSPSNTGMGPFDSFTLMAPIELSSFNTLSTPAALNYFQDAPSIFTDTFYSSWPQSWGGIWTFSATSTVTLTYVYAAPDGGVTAGLLALGVALAAVTHRRLNPGMDRFPPTL